MCFSVQCCKSCFRLKVDKVDKTMKCDGKPRYVPDPTEIYGDDEEMYTGSDDDSEYYVEPKPYPVLVEQPNISTPTEKMADNQIYKVSGIFVIDGKEKEYTGTLNLTRDEKEEIKVTKNEKKPDLVPLHLTNLNFPPILRRFSQSSTKSENSQNRRISSYSIPEDEKTIQKVRQALNRITVQDSPQIGIDPEPLPHSRRSSQDQITETFNPSFCENQQENYNEPYDHMFNGSSRNSRSSSIYCNSKGEELYGNQIIHRLNNFVHLPPSKNSMKKSSLVKRPPVPAPRTIFEQDHIYEVII